jgi:phosphohistidine phosphatase SixA
MDLFVLRHGEAGKTIPSGGSDSKRPLTVAGEKEMIVISKALRKMGVTFDVILTSPLKRARQTADIVAKESRHKGRYDSCENCLQKEISQLFIEIYRRLKKERQYC